MKLINLDNLQFSMALVEQADEIAALVNSVYRGDNARKGWTTSADLFDGIRITAERIREIINSGIRVIILAVMDRMILGCVRLLRKESTCWLGLLSVDVNYQTLGIGRMLIGRGEGYAKEVFKCDEMKLEVIEIKNELIGYYERRGYRLTGERESLKADTASTNPKIRNLYTVILAKKL